MVVVLRREQVVPAVMLVEALVEQVMLVVQALLALLDLLVRAQQMV